jgi:uncharacterized protein (DUF433 family)
VPFRSLIDYLEQGSTLAEILEHFPTVTHEQAVAALEEAGRRWWRMRVLLDESLPLEPES